MNYHGYEIRPYRPEDISEAAEVQRHLYGVDTEITRNYFRWKYEENPNVDEPLGFVAINQGEIVGFRGFFVTRWRIGNQDKTIRMLSSSDVCVHPDHRRRGLFGAMTEHAIKEYSDSTYNGYINLTSNQYSMPCDLKLGWQKVAERRILRRCNVLGLMKYSLARKLPFLVDGFTMPTGRFGSIEISDEPNVEMIVSVLSNQQCGKKRFELCEDEAFLKWKYRNNMMRYIFCYYIQDNSVTGYVVLGVRRYSPRLTNKASIIDFAQIGDVAISELLRYITSRCHSSILDVWDCGMDCEPASVFSSLGFSSDNFTVKLQGRSRGMRYLLVRPQKFDYTEEDWFVHDLDIRKIESWDIHEVCSDDS